MHVHHSAESILGHSSRTGNITVGTYGQPASVLHKNIQPLEKYAAFLWIITRAQINGMISLQEKEETFYTLLFSSVILYEKKSCLNQTISIINSDI